MKYSREILYLRGSFTPHMRHYPKIRAISDDSHRVRREKEEQIFLVFLTNFLRTSLGSIGRLSSSEVERVGNGSVLAKIIVCKNNANKTFKENRRILEYIDNLQEWIQRVLLNNFLCKCYMGFCQVQVPFYIQTFTICVYNCCHKQPLFVNIQVKVDWAQFVM